MALLSGLADRLGSDQATLKLADSTTRNTASPWQTAHTPTAMTALFCR